MPAGMRRHRLAFQALATTQNEAGEDIGTWTTTFTLWGSVEPLEGRELLAAQQIIADVNHQHRILYKAGIVPTMRILWNGRVFDIKHVLNPAERNIDMKLLSREVISA